ncbi:MAG TPA: hypothetical protein VG936_02340 [Lacunisphaera sp.]|nr:hypothetical protein [Lacunisphaera sp.]
MDAAGEKTKKNVDAIGNLFGQLGRKFEGRDIAHALATGLGINIESISRGIARLVTGISEAEERAYHALEQLSDRAAELGLRNMSARLSGEKQLEMALRDRDRLQKEIENSHATTAVEQEQIALKRIRLEERIAEINRLRPKFSLETQARAELEAVQLRESTVAADATRTSYEKKKQEVGLLHEEIAARTTLLEIIEATPAENGETEAERTAKIARLKAENSRAQSQLVELQFGNTETRRHQESADAYNEFVAANKGARTNVGNSALEGVHNWIVGMGSGARQVADSVEHTLGDAVDRISDGISGWITGAQTFGQALSNIGESIIKSILNDVISITTHLIVSAQIEKAMAAFKAPGGGILSAIGSFFGFADGGYTGGKPSGVAGVVHGGEWVAPSWMVNNANFGSIIGGLEAARNGGAASLATVPGGGGNSPRVYILQDPQEFARLMQQNSGDWFVQSHAAQMRKNA